MDSVRQLFYAVVTITVKTAQWLVAKVKGEPYDPGMDMPPPSTERRPMTTTDPTTPVPEPRREGDDLPVEQPQPHVQPAPTQPVEQPGEGDDVDVPAEAPTVDPQQAPGEQTGVPSEPEREG